jgi:hypothetical protein
MNVFNILPISAFIVTFNLLFSVYITGCRVEDKQLTYLRERADIIMKQNNFCCDNFEIRTVVIIECYIVALEKCTDYLGSGAVPR